MKCSDVQRYAVENAGQDLAPEYLDHLVSCEPCRKTYERALTVVKLVALKRYEQPDPSAEARCILAVRQRIDAGEGRWLGWLDFLDGPWVSAVRYGAVAALGVLMVGAFLSVGKVPALKAPALVLDDRATSTEGIVRTPTGTDTLHSASPVFFAGTASNREPGKVQYGPASSRLVGFEY
jgi:hypothetical protein